MSLKSFLDFNLKSTQGNGLLMQVTTFSQLLPQDEIKNIIPNIPFHSMILTTFPTEQTFRAELRPHLTVSRDSPFLVVIQCSNSDENEQMRLVACAQYICKEMMQSMLSTDSIHVLFVLQLKHAKATIKVLGGLHSD